MSSIPPAATTPETGEPKGSDWRAGLLLPWFGAALPLIAISVAAFALTKARTIADLFFFEQDFPVVILMGAALMALRFLPARLFSVAALAFPDRLRSTVGVLVAGVAIVAAGGWFVVCHAYPLSMDEFMTGFDATIFRQGRLVADLPAAWRAYDFPLQPQFLIHAPGGSAWASIYLPVNAMIRAGFGLVGASWATGAVYAAASVAAVAALARRFWPDRPGAAVVAALLLASSSQFLVTAMTPYAMSAHLTFNLVWLWLFLRPGWPSQAGAIAVGALACGLHQVVFHPLFVAPFVFGLWLGRQWGRAAFFTAAYALIILFWILYWKLVLPGGGSGGPQAPSDLGAALLIHRVQTLLANFKPDGVGFMAKNLVRFIAWQNPMLPALAVLGTGAALRAKGVFRALIVGMALTLAAVWILEPFQGHGWGYRYLHGFLGSLALIAALGWVRLTESLDAPGRRVARAMLVICTAFAWLALLPLHAAQASGMIRPYAAAAGAIDRTPADVVLVDPTGLFYAADLIRNDPFLRNSPKRMDLGTMTDAQVRGVCAGYRVALFDRREGRALGIEDNPAGPAPRMQALRTLLTTLRCGERSVPTDR